MAKRLNDTDIWKRPNFRRLSPVMKLVWIYLKDNCDNCGVWHADFGLMSYQLGEEVTEEEVLTHLGHKLERIGPEKFLIRSFITFQYGDQLDPHNNAHKPVINFLRKIGKLEAPDQGVPGPCLGDQDKNKSKNKDQDKSKDQEKEKRKKETFDFEALYKKYPLKLGKSEGLEKCQKRIKTPEDYALLEKAIERFRDHHKTKGTDPQYLPYFSTFMSSWVDWVDPETGTAVGPPKEKSFLDFMAEQGVCDDATGIHGANGTP